MQKIHLYVNLYPAADEGVIISREKAMAFRRWLGEWAREAGFGRLALR